MQSDIFYLKENGFGEGLFAKKVINKFEKILLFEDPVVTGKKSIKLDFKYYTSAIGNGLQIGKDAYIYLKDPGRVVNHSCNPNSGVIKDNLLIAIKKINIDEEITFDYSTTMDEDCWTLEGKCESKNCRKIIKDFKFLPKEIQNKYLKKRIVQKFISQNFQNINF
ncbi:SET domain-containing protein [Candidatus Pacearchaeota archaeon]|nr:SET domain-containing protein [Candidatus Pacearchaeota archaeon]